MALPLIVIAVLKFCVDDFKSIAALAAASTAVDHTLTVRTHVSLTSNSSGTSPVTFP